MLENWPDLEVLQDRVFFTRNQYLETESVVNNIRITNELVNMLTTAFAGNPQGLLNQFNMGNSLPSSPLLYPEMLWWQFPENRPQLRETARRISEDMTGWGITTMWFMDGHVGFSASGTRPHEFMRWGNEGYLPHFHSALGVVLGIALRRLGSDHELAWIMEHYEQNLQRMIDWQEDWHRNRTISYNNALNNHTFWVGRQAVLQNNITRVSGSLSTIRQRIAQLEKLI